MEFTPLSFPLKDGRTAVLRSVCGTDAAAMIRLLVDTAAETDFLLGYPEERSCMSVEDEAHFLDAQQASPDALMLLCEVDGQIAGNCCLTFSHRLKIAHRAEVAIALRKAYWGQGIGTRMFEVMLAQAQQRPGVLQVDLDVIEGNSRARALYEKMGFRVVGVRPDAIRLKDGTLLNEYTMMLKL